MLVLTMPVYDEGASAVRAVRDAVAAARAIGGDFRVVVYDDGSTDDTGPLDAEVARHAPHARLHRLAVNRGVAAFFRWCVEELAPACAAGDVLVVLEGDGTSDLAVLARLVERVGGCDTGGMAGPTGDVAGGADVAVASRYVAGGASVGFPWRRRLQSRAVNGLLGLLYGAGVRDRTMFYRAYRVAPLAALAAGGTGLRSGGFTANAELLVTLERRGARVVEVPQTYAYDRKEGASKLALGKHVRELARLLRAQPPGRPRRPA